jgi:cytochrome c oxidase subunit III
VSARSTIDVAHLPDHAFGSRSTLWWGTLGIIVIELTVFIVTVASYFYLQGNEPSWPPPGSKEPLHFWGTINTIILLASLIPNQFVKNAAEKKEMTKVRVWIVVADLFAIAFCVIRIFEYRVLQVSWDSNAYGSVTWTLLSLHTLHLVTDLADSVVLTALMFTHHGYDGKRFVDVSENAFYWYFVVLVWIPIYLVLYWSPRWIG